MKISNSSKSFLYFRKVFVLSFLVLTIPLNLALGQDREDSLKNNAIGQEIVLQEDLNAIAKSLQIKIDIEDALALAIGEQTHLETLSARYNDSIQSLNKSLIELPPLLKGGKNINGKRKLKTKKPSPDSLVDSTYLNREFLEKAWANRIKVLAKRESIENNLISGLETMEEKGLKMENLQVRQQQNSCDLFDMSQKVQQVWKNKTGPFRFRFNKVTYLAYVVDGQKESIGFHWTQPSGKEPLAHFDAVATLLEKSGKKDIRMLTNGGMYTTALSPKGLFISEGKLKVPLDSLRKNQAEPGVNFYLQPNGVFWIDAQGKGHIEKTEIFHLKNKAKTGPVKYPKVYSATQSGPMLVINGQVNPQFGKKSNNAKIRSGVGIKQNGQCIFLCTVEDETFYTFSQVFTCVFGCREALFLDGAISRMHLPTLHKDPNAGPFGPILSVVGK